jgi:hypothetical protein
LVTLHDDASHKLSYSCSKTIQQSVLLWASSSLSIGCRGGQETVTQTSERGQNVWGTHCAQCWKRDWVSRCV